MVKYQIIAATGCPTGIAHTYMAQEALEQAAKKVGISIKVETHGQSGVEHALTQQEIDEADGVIIAADKDVNPERFVGKKLINVSVTKGMKDADQLINRILNDQSIPIYQGTGEKGASETASISSGSFWHQLYVYVMNGVSHMLPLVVAGGVLLAISFFWGINSADPKNTEYNQFAFQLNSIGSLTMGLMVPVLCAYIAEAIAKQSGLIVGFATGMIALTNGTGFLGGILGGFLAGYTVLLLQKVFKKLPKSLDGLKAIFLFPVLGVLVSGLIMWYLSTPMQNINEGMINFLKGMENSSPILLGIVVGIMCASDFGGPINKAAYLTGTALLAQGNYFFMAGVSAACIAPPLATGFAVLMNKKAYSAKERSAGYVNFLLGSTHITEGAIPFAAKNPLLNIPAFMIGSAVAATLTYITKISVPAPHGGFIVLPLVNHPMLWVIWIVIGALISGVLLAMIAEKQYKKDQSILGLSDNQTIVVDHAVAEQSHVFNEIFDQQNIELGVNAGSKEEALQYLSKLVVERGYASNQQEVEKKYQFRESESSTGMEQGIAIPHAQSATINKSGMFIVKLATPIEWGSLDGSQIDILISFIIPDEDNQDHLKYLADVSKLLVHEQFVTELKAAQTKQAIFKLFQ